MPSLLLLSLQAISTPPPSWAPWLEWNKIGVPVATALVLAFLSHYLGRRIANLNADLASKVQAKLDSDRAQRTESLEKQKRDYSEEIARLNVALTTSLQKELESDRALRSEALEHLKRDLQDTLASRTRRAEYLKAQISNLYGPLNFHLELTSLRVQTAQKINEASRALSERGQSQGISAYLEEEEVQDQTATVNRYLEIGYADNNEAVKILRTGWSWIDEEDQKSALDFACEIERGNVEFLEHKKRRLSEVFYSERLLGTEALKSPIIVNPIFISRMREKLYTKQRELSGLTTLHEHQPTRSTQTPLPPTTHPSDERG